MKDYFSTNSHYLTSTVSLQNGWENVLFELGGKGFRTYMWAPEMNCLFGWCSLMFLLSLPVSLWHHVRMKGVHFDWYMKCQTSTQKCCLKGLGGGGVERPGGVQKWVSLSPPLHTAILSIPYTLYGEFPIAIWAFRCLLWGELYRGEDEDMGTFTRSIGHY